MPIPGNRFPVAEGRQVRYGSDRRGLPDHRPETRAEITVGLAELGVKAIFATKPMCRTLAEANAMIETCAKHGVILAMACHLNWYSYYTTTRRLIAEGAIGPLKTTVDAIEGVPIH